MKKIMKKQGWLVVAAVLTIGLSSCTRDDIVNGMQAGDSQTINITVGAGIDDDASTRSAVVYNETTKTRTLTFTSGDRLFVKGTVGEKHQADFGNVYYDYMFYGILPMVDGFLSQDGKSAKFTGDLTLLTPKKIQQEGEEYYYYSYEKNANAIDDFEGKDPLGMSTDAEAHLVHQDAVEDKDFSVEIDNFFSPIDPLSSIRFSCQQDWAADVNTLMTTITDIGNYDESYDAEKKSFKLVTYSGPIFNCAISGLTSNTSYNLYYGSNLEWPETSFNNPLKADASGKAAFAFFASSENSTHVLKFEPLDANGEVNVGGEVLMVNLRARELENDMVYNITSTAYPEGYMMDVAVNATTPSGVSTAIASALETANALIPVNFILSGTVATTSSDKDITIPTDAVDVSLTFNNVPSEAGGTLGIKTNKAGNPASTANNKIFITIPQSDSPINLNIDAPTSTVALQSTSGGAANFKEVVANTAYNTLIVDDDVTLNNVDIQDGRVMVKDDAILESWTFAAKNNDDKVIINEDGGIVPMIQGTDENGNNIYQIVSENGIDPYYAKSLKVVKDDADYSNMYFLNNDPSISPLKVITICDGAVLKTNWISMETIEGIGTAKIDYQLNINDGFNIGFTIGYGTDDNAKWYQHQCDLYHIKTLKNIIFSEPEVILSESKQAEVEEKEAEGYVQFPTQMVLDVNETIEDCTFNFEYVHFCPWASYPLVKGCKFGKTSGTNTIDIDALDPRGNAFDINSTYSMSFENCTFSDNTLFNIKFGTYSSGTIDFTNCTYNGQTLDNLTLLNQIIDGQVIISINGTPKYQTSYDGDNRKWVVNQI